VPADIAHTPLVRGVDATNQTLLERRYQTGFFGRCSDQPACWLLNRGAIICGMPRPRKREEWLQDIEARQRNIVFPDTVNNEARFWRNIIEGKQRLTVVQKVGIGLVGLTAGAIVFLTIFPAPGFSWWKLVAGGIEWLIGFGILGVFLLIFRLSQRSNRK
jgi:hypothetical protein